MFNAEAAARLFSYPVSRTKSMKMDILSPRESYVALITTLPAVKLMETNRRMTSPPGRRVVSCRRRKGQRM